MPTALEKRQEPRVCKEIIWTLCCWPPGPLARRERRAIPGAVCKERATQPAGTAPRSPVGRSPEGRGGGRASAALPLLDDITTSPASRRLASARPALAPKCTPYFLTGPNSALQQPAPPRWQAGNA